MNDRNLLLSSLIDNGNNDAIEQMIYGQPRDAIAILLSVLDSWKMCNNSCNINLMMEASCQDQSYRQTMTDTPFQLYSVELKGNDEMEEADPTFPFRWYGKPLAISTCDSYNDDEDGESPRHGLLLLQQKINLKIVVVHYNLGIAYQLEESANLTLSGRRINASTFECYSLALRALTACQQDMMKENTAGNLQMVTPQPHQQHHQCHQQHQQQQKQQQQRPLEPPLSPPHQYPPLAQSFSGTVMTSNEMLSFALLYMAIVNNLLFQYAQIVDLDGLHASLNVLRKILEDLYKSSDCDVLKIQEAWSDFEFFHCNAILFSKTGSLCVAPAA